MLGRIEDAEDAKQDILIKVITSLSSYKEKSLFSTWVYKIAVNHLINEKNKKRKKEKSEKTTQMLDFAFLM